MNEYMEIYKRWSENPHILLAGSILFAALAGANISTIYIRYMLGLDIRYTEVAMIFVMSAVSLILGNISLHISKNNGSNPKKETSKE